LVGNPILVQKFYKINEIIKNLYDEDQDYSQRYSRFLQALKEVVYFDSGNILFFSEHQGKYELVDLYQVGWNQETIDQYVKYYYKEDDIYPVFATKTPLVIRCTDIFQDARKKTDFYLTFMKPNGFEFSLECNIILPLEINYYGVVSLFRLSSKKNFSPEEGDMLEIFQPHLSNLAKKSFPKNVFGCEHYSGSMISGNIIIDNNFDVLSRSDDFERIVKKYSSIEKPEIEQKIIELCKTMKYADCDIYRRDLSSKLDQYPVYLEIIIADKKSMPGRNIYACNIYDISEILIGCLSHVSKKYGLSPREADIVSYQIKGYKIEEIASSLCISNSTVKKHLTGIYNKLQIDSQMQLLKILGLGSMASK
jgi:DNA-binding CsgD family transcriptional regulator